MVHGEAMAFAAAKRAGVRVGRWVWIKGKERAQKWAHCMCFENFNETMQCGIDRGSCRSPVCALSENFLR